MKTLFVKPPGREGEVEETTKNAFLNASTKKDTRTENQAISNSSTGDLFVDDFANSGAYRGRNTDEVFVSASTLWAINPLMAMQLFLYLRLITRKIKGFFASETVQRGQGNKDESLRRLLWVAYNHPSAFYHNLWLVPLVGTWKDLWTLMGIDFKNELKREHFYELMIRGLNDKDMRALVVKYMPQIKAISKLKTDRAKRLNFLAKEFATFMKLNYADYRKFKTSNGAAHIWQAQISKGFYDDIDFRLIPGKALTKLVKGKFLGNHNLIERYNEWIQSQPVAKFTGYVYELFTQAKNTNIPTYEKMTIDKQFDGLVALGKENNGALKGNIWCALDTSGSMGWNQFDGGVTPYDICISLGIYFSAMNEGAFKDSVIMFDNESRKLQLRGTFTEKAGQIRGGAMGGTNFQSVINEIVRIRTANPDIPIEDYPETLLVVSDMQFNPSGSYHGGSYPPEEEETNYETAMRKLEAVGLPRITIIWWQVTGRTKDFPSTIDDVGTYLISGFDGAIISFLLGGNAMKEDGTMKSMNELMQDALTQDVLSLVEIN